MFDVGFSELILMAIVALVVLGPEKLPHAARVAGAWVGKIRRTVSNMQAEIEREVSAQEMRDRLQKEIEAVRIASEEMKSQQPFQAVTNEMQALQSEIHASLPPAIDTGTPVTPTILPAVAETTPLPTEITPADQPIVPGPDGEAAYREWLASQKNANLKPATPPVDEATKETPAS
jgi:sec-independent protein translocase protein TatB